MSVIAAAVNSAYEPSPNPNTRSPVRKGPESSPAFTISPAKSCPTVSGKVTEKNCFMFPSRIFQSTGLEPRHPNRGHSFFTHLGRACCGVSEDTAFVVVVMQLRAKRSCSFADQKKNLRSHQHAEGRRDEIDPQGVPVSGAQRGAECPGRICAHS